MIEGGIIGIGKIAQTAHLPAFGDKSLRRSVRIVAAADGNAESRQIAQERFPQLRLYGSVEEMFEAERLDFVDICTPPHTHAELIGTALRRRVHILCEKPLATVSKDAVRLVEEISQAPEPIVFLPCHQYRYAPLWQQMQSFIRERGSGGKFQAQFEVYRTEPDPGLLRDGNIWRLDPGISGGGILADTGIHYLYLILWMFGVPIRVTARIHRFRQSEIRVEDTATVILEGAWGEARIHLTWAADRRTNRASVVCAKGSLVYDGETVVQTVGDDRQVFSMGNVADKSTYIAQYVCLFADFVKRIQSGVATSCQLREAKDTVTLLRACYASASSNRTVLV